MVRLDGPPASMGGRSTRHLPSLATVDACWPWNETVTASPLRAVPQTGTLAPRWSTAPSVNRLWGFTPANAAGPHARATRVAAHAIGFRNASLILGPLRTYNERE